MGVEVRQGCQGALDADGDGSSQEVGCQGGGGVLGSPAPTTCSPLGYTPGSLAWVDRGGFNEVHDFINSAEGQSGDGIGAAVVDGDSPCAAVG